jgi:hypothetical protein
MKKWASRLMQREQFRIAFVGGGGTVLESRFGHWHCRQMAE